MLTQKAPPVLKLFINIIKHKGCIIEIFKKKRVPLFWGTFFSFVSFGCVHWDNKIWFLRLNKKYKGKISVVRMESWR